MKINPISSYGIAASSLTKERFNKTNLHFPDIAEKNLKAFDLLSLQNRCLLSFGRKYSLGLLHDELVDRTSEKGLYVHRLLDVNSKEYENLADGDKKALYHLLKAGEAIDDVYLDMNDSDNIPFKEYLDYEISKGNKDAKLTKILFDAQKGIYALDNNGKSVSLLKGSKPKLGVGLYPSDLSKDEFHTILEKMLDDGKKDKVEAILNNHSVIERCEDELVAVDYGDKFKKRFAIAADELEEACKTSTNSEFNNYLMLQADALRSNDPMKYAYADLAWSKMQDTPLEFSFTRESYQDLMTPTVFENKHLAKRLEENGIIPLQKDCLGVRVGIVNKETTKNLLKTREYMPIIARHMPLNEKYSQETSFDNSKQAVIDADIIALYGDEAVCSAGIVSAQNLPNNDKPSIQILGGGRRNVYHRQIMQNLDANIEEVMNATIEPHLHKYHNKDALTLFIAGHENGHSLGPKNVQGLGKYKSIIEETKADLTSVYGADVLNKEGIYSDKKKDELVFCFVRRNMLKGKPNFSSTHRVKDLIQTNYLRDKGAVSISDKGIMDIEMDKVPDAVKSMLTDIIDIQLSGDVNKAKAFVDKYYFWDDRLEKLSSNLKKAQSALNCRIDAPLAEKILCNK